MIVGSPSTGKTTSLQHLRNQENFIYLNFDRKDLTFKGNFRAEKHISDPYDVLGYLDAIESNPEVQGAVIDTLTFMMGLFERRVIDVAHDSRAAWGEYGRYYKDVMDRIKSGTKDYIILSHVNSIYNEESQSLEDRVPIKGAIGKLGCESDFSHILTTKLVKTRVLADRECALLSITDEDREDESKLVFQTRPFKSEASLSRAPIGFWERSELYIDNNINHVLDRIKEYRS